MQITRETKLRDLCCPTLPVSGSTCHINLHTKQGLSRQCQTFLLLLDSLQQGLSTTFYITDLLVKLASPQAVGESLNSWATCIAARLWILLEGTPKTLQETGNCGEEGGREGAREGERERRREGEKWEGGREWGKGREGGKVIKKKKNWAHIVVLKLLSGIVYLPMNLLHEINTGNISPYLTPHHVKCGTGGGVNVLQVL